MSRVDALDPIVHVESDGESSHGTLLDSGSDELDAGDDLGRAAEMSADVKASPEHERDNVVLNPAVSSGEQMERLASVRHRQEEASSADAANEVDVPRPCAITPERVSAAQALAQQLRRKEPLLHMRQRTSRDDPNFVDNFFKASRLHFIGAWRERYDEILDRF
eukprot:TRINITY_DN16631_c0_g1_i4.p1 TRINITY_DN16631_c0_g1~~TRINITY_DN16631_c0_g1_i4.p1  ORF type:complete len:179 (+),score=28.80 TRINITY_DN16631_c0_g1_i4:47-538(+)